MKRMLRSGTFGVSCKGESQKVLFFYAALLLLSFSYQTVSSASVSIVSGFEKQTLRQGENFTLECKATGLYHVTITWLLDGLPLEYNDPKITDSVHLTADNPHQANFGTLLQSRYSIQTSNEILKEQLVANNDVINDEIENKEDIVRNNNASTQPMAVASTTTEPTVFLQPANIQSKIQSLIPPHIPLTEDRMVTVSSSLSLNNASVRDGGIYSCVARDVIMETASWRRKIAVTGTLSIRKNNPIVALIDSVVIIPCTVLGTGDDIPVQWYYSKFSNHQGNGVVEGPESLWTSLPSDDRQTVHSNGSLEIRDARKANEGIYLCKADLDGKLENMSTPLKVMIPPEITPFSFRPVQVGLPLAKSCVVSRGDFPLDISWYKDGVLLRTRDGVVIHRLQKRVLSVTISSLTLDSAGNYTCCAANNVSRACTTGSLVVLDPPKIFGLPATVSKISGNDIIIPCKATGYPKPDVTWTRVRDDSTRDYIPIPIKDGKKRTGQSEKSHKISQTKDGSLIIANVSSQEEGKYLCRAVNKVDELSRIVSLQVHNPARIIEISGTEDVVYRNDVTIGCATWGDNTVEVTWLKDGIVLPLSDRHIEATILDFAVLESRYSVAMNRLIIANTSRSDTGMYTCLAKNEYGTSKKNIDVLVRAPPTAPRNFEVIDKGTSFLRMIVSPGKDNGGSRLMQYEVTYIKTPDKEDLPRPPKGRFAPTPNVVSEPIPVTVTQAALASAVEQEIILDALECGTEYQLSIRAINDIGTSFQATNLTASTIGTVPVIPAVNELVVYKNQTSVILDLRAWQNGGCPITVLWIEFARHGDTDWNATTFDGAVLEKALSAVADDGEKSGQNPGHFVLTDLQTGTWYKIWSSACNHAGCNYVTHSVATLLPNGATVPPISNDDIVKEVSDGDDARFLVPMICGFGLVVLLVLLLLLYRHKQRAKKLFRMKEARKMANTLLYKTDDDSSPTSGMRVELPDAANEDNSASVLAETSISNTSEDDHSMPVTDCAAGNTVTEPFLDDISRENSDILAALPNERNITPPSQTKVSLSSNDSAISKKSEGKKSLKDNLALAVFRDMACSDDENLAVEPLICDESAFDDSGTWSYFQPGSRARRPKPQKPTPKVESKATPRRLSSCSSGTDEELAQVFGLPCSKRKGPDLERKRDIKSDINENHRRPSSNSELQKKTPPKLVQQQQKFQPPRQPHVRNKPDQFSSIMMHEKRSNSTGMVQKSNPRHFKPLPGDAIHHSKRTNAPVQPRPVVPNTNPFKTTFNPLQPIPPSFHRPKMEHIRGHTYSNDNTTKWKGTFPSTALSNAETTAPSPYGERQWVDTYDSRYGTNRSKPSSWGSIELDKKGLYTPPPNATASHSHHGKNSPECHTREGNHDHEHRVSKDSSRKIDTNSPRDSGIGSDEGPTSRHLTSSVSPPSTKGGGMQKSLESLDELEHRKGDRLSTCSSGNTSMATGKNSVFPLSPPLTPPISGTKLAPHIFVDISSKCNTTPTRKSRSSYPPCERKVSAGSNYHMKQPKRPDYPTPPPSGPTSPEDRSIGRPSNKSYAGGWGVADLDGRGRQRRHDSNSRLLKNDSEISRSTLASGDTKYSICENDTWQASTLV